MRRLGKNHFQLNTAAALARMGKKLIYVTINPKAARKWVREFAPDVVGKIRFLNPNEEQPKAEPPIIWRDEWFWEVYAAQEADSTFELFR